MNTKQIYNMVCAYCETVYDFRVYQNNILQKPGYRPDPDKDIMLYSHGICKPCKKEVMQQMKLDLEQIIKKGV